MRWNQSSSVQKLEEGSRREVSFDSVQKLDFVRRKTLVSGLISIYGLLPEDWCDKGDFWQSINQIRRMKVRFSLKTLFLSGEMELKNVANHTWCKRRSLLPALKEEQGNGSA
jgi:hypothetical protein